MKKLGLFLFMVFGLVILLEAYQVMESEKVKAENKNEVFSERDNFKYVIFDPFEGNYYLMTDNFAILMNEYVDNEYNEELLKSLNYKFKDSQIDVYFYDDETIVGYYVHEKNHELDVIAY